MSINPNSLPARAGKVPALRRHARGTGTVRLSGQDYYLGPWPDGQADPPDAVRLRYNELVARWLANGRRPLPREPDAGPVLVADLVRRFLARCPDDYPAGSREPEQYDLACRPLVALHGTTPAAEFRPRHLEEVRADLIPASVYDGLRCVEALRRGLGGVRESPRREPATLDQMERLCEELSEPMAAMVRLLWLTGMRPGEVRRLRADEVDRSAAVWVYRPAEHKTEHRGDVRAVALGPKAVAVLSPWLALVPSGGPVFDPRRLIDTFKRARAKRRAGEVLSDLDEWACGWWGRVPNRADLGAGEEYTADGFAASVQTARKRAGLPKGVSAYCFRHAVRMRIGRSHGDEAARAVLGQRCIDTTTHYGRIDEARAAEVMGEVG